MAWKGYTHTRTMPILLYGLSFSLNSLTINLLQILKNEFTQSRGQNHR